MDDDMIRLDGVSSADKEICLIEWSLPLSPERKWDTETLPGQPLSVDYREIEPPVRITLKMAIIAQGQAAIRSAYRAAAPWLWNGTRLEISDLPGAFFDGRVTRVTQAEMTDAYMVFETVFTANPPYAQYALSKRAGFVPSVAAPLPEQITPETETCSKIFSAAGYMPAVETAGMSAPALYFAVTGTWRSLVLGGLNLSAQDERATVYIDCERQTIYAIDAGARTPYPATIAGAYPFLPASGVMAVEGTDLNVTVRMLVVERG